MNISATLKTESKDAKNIASTLEVDNVNDVEAEGLRIHTRDVNGQIISEIKSKKINTLINTLDDLIRCQIVAEKTIE